VKWKRPLFAAITIVAFFGLLELVLLVVGVRPLLAERDPFAGFSKQVSVFELDSSAGVWRTPERARLRSFNDQQFLARKPKNGLRVFTIGGSSAYGFPWGAREAFPHLLGEALAQTYPDRTVESINAAAMSYGSHRLRILVHELMRYKPDVLVVYGGHNEFVERSFYSKMLERPEELDTLKRVMSHSRLFSAATRFYENLKEPVAQADSPLGLDVRREKPQEMANAEREEVVRQFDENLSAIIDLCEREGVTVVLSTVPSNLTGWLPNGSSFPDGMTPPEKQRIDETLVAAEEALNDNDPPGALTRLDGIDDVADRHALWWFIRGNALASLGQSDEARQAYTRARDLDAAPSRASTALNDVIRSLAVKRDIPLVDSVSVVEKFAPNGLPGFNLFEDYVHPKPLTHQLIAEAIWMELVEPDVPSRFWSLVGSKRPVVSDLVDQPIGDSGQQTPAMLFNLAVVLENQGHTDQAEAKYRACLELHPGYFYARSNLARLLYGRGQLAEAENEYRRVVAEEPDHLRAVHGLGVTLQKQGRAQEALEFFERATRIDPKSGNSWLLHGLTLVQLQQMDRAAISFAHAADLNPTDANVRVLLGGALLRVDRFDEAENAFRAALELDSGSIKARNGVAAALANRGELDAAERLYLESLRLDPDNAQARRALAAIDRRRNE